MTVEVECQINHNGWQKDNTEEWRHIAIIGNKLYIDGELKSYPNRRLTEEERILRKGW